MSKSTLAVLFLITGVALAGPPRELTDADARAVAWEFVARGAGAPLRELEPRDLAATKAKPGTHALHGPTIAFVCSRFSIEVARDGTVVAFRVKGVLRLRGKTDDERSAELARRSRLPLARAEERARQFLSFRVDEWRSRRFDLVSARTTIEDGCVAHRVELVERGPFANRIVIAIDPASEEVVAFEGSDVREKEPAAPSRGRPNGELVRTR